MIFENSGICLFSKNYSLTPFEEDDELTTGFLSVLYGFIDSKFGILTSITTQEYLLLISTIQDIYITLVVERFEQNNETVEKDRITLLNKRVENACKSQLGLIERKVGSVLLQMRIQKVNDVNYRSIFSEIENEFDAIISQGLRKIDVVKKIFENHPITGIVEIFKN